MHDFIDIWSKSNRRRAENSVKISLKCFSKLADPDTCDFRDSTENELNDGQTVEALVERARINRKSVKIVFVNNKNVDLDTVL